MRGSLLLSLVLLLAASKVRGLAPEPGIWNFVNLTGESNYVGVVKNAFDGSRLDIRVDCQTESTSKPVRVLVGYSLRRTVCWEEFLALDSKEAKEQQVYRSYYDNPSIVAYRVGAAASKDYVQEFIKEEFIAVCNQDFTIPPHETYRSEKKPVYELEKDRQLAVSIFGNMNMMENNYERQRASDADENGGVYLLVVHVAIISNTQPVAKCHRYAYIQKATTFADIAFSPLRNLQTKINYDFFGQNCIFVEQLQFVSKIQGMNEHNQEKMASVNSTHTANLMISPSLTQIFAENPK